MTLENNSTNNSEKILTGGYSYADLPVEERQRCTDQIDKLTKNENSVLGKLMSRVAVYRLKNK